MRNQFIFFLVFLPALLLGQVSPRPNVSVPTATTDFLVNVPAGTTVFCNSTGREYVTLQTIITTDDLTSASAKFKEIPTGVAPNDSVKNPWIYLAGYTIQRGTGNVGIGTTSPSEKLEISGSGTQRFLITETGTGVQTSLKSASGGYGIFGTVSNHAMRVQTNNLDRMTIDNTGNVGIGTTGPSNLLDVSKSVSGGVGAIVQLTNPATTAANNAVELRLAPSSAYASRYAAIQAINDGSNSIVLSFLTGAGASITEKMRILSGGGITMYGGNLTIASPGILKVDGTENSSFAGNVGIGTTAPASKLSINGGLHVGGDSDAGDNNLIVDGTIKLGTTYTNTLQNALMSSNKVITLPNATGTVALTSDIPSISGSTNSYAMFTAPNVIGDGAIWNYEGVPRAAAFHLFTGESGIPFKIINDPAGITTMEVDQDNSTITFFHDYVYDGVSFGSIGVGTVQPEARLDMVSRKYSFDQFRTMTDASSPYDSCFVITKTGSTGIGTITPFAPLTVSSNSTPEGTFISTASLGANVGAGVGLYVNALPTASGQRIGSYTFGSRVSSTSSHGAGLTAYSEGAWTAGSSYPTYLVLQTTASGSAARTERIRITSVGNVGIGVTSPTSLLHIRKDNTSVSDPQFVIDNVAGDYKLAIGVNSTTSLATIQPWSNPGEGFAPSHLAINPTGGYVGVGTLTPTCKLDVVGQAKVSTLMVNGYNVTVNSDIALPQSGIWSANETSAYYTAGNVGIGYNTPTHKLEVAGTVGFTGGAVDINAGSNYATNICTGTSTGTVTIGGSAAQVINIGATGTGDHDLLIGNLVTGSTTTIRSGDGGMNLVSAGSNVIESNPNSILSLNSGINAPTSINAGTSTGTVTIGGSQAQTIEIANNASGIKTVTIGNTVSGSTTDIRASVPGINVSKIALVSGSNATATTSLVDITGLIITSLAAYGYYEFEAVLIVGTSNDNNGNKYAVNFTSSGSPSVVAMIDGSYTSTANKTERISALTTASGVYMTTASQTGGILIKGILIVGSLPGSITIQHQHPTSGTSTVYVGSYLKVTRIS